MHQEKIYGNSFPIFFADLEEKQRVREDDAIRVREYDDEYDMISDIIYYNIHYFPQKAK